MVLRYRARKALLLAHVTASVGWLGAVACFLGLSIVGLASENESSARAAYVAMESAGWFVLLPLAVASLLTGLLQSWTSAWGLLRHYWVVFKLAINLVAIAVLVLYVRTLTHLADAAASVDGGPDVARDPSPAVHAAAALVLLLVATALGIYKPRGLTPFARPRRDQDATPA